MDYKDKKTYNNRNSYSNNNRGNYSNRQQEIELPRDFVINGFEKLREELMLNETKEIAKVFVDSKLTSNQLRLFFNEVKALQNKINKDQQEFERNYPFILMLKSKAEYKYKDGKGTIKKAFRDFINESVDYIKQHKSINTFENFCMIFETIVGYYYGFGGEKNK
ncbi:type III-A CRISPR-associated protein Csm2 [Romboutsia maritimum]|uniref:CRISPR system Cms protein Csm2 n=1 Tax=Romboutsia maritimum TaxID=2020948 RepID=A0A371ITI4_9FIRM|nr:type III-A CRISPR-associated protein Csm2 [Romboutsia maritimum]RDY23794.1 type III-A CRISPR-associated protein Csm2 [Romboutsia maritimum]